MNKCCRETYKKILEEILLHINLIEYKSIYKLRITLEHAIRILNETEEERKDNE